MCVCVDLCICPLHVSVIGVSIEVAILISSGVASFMSFLDMKTISKYVGSAVSWWIILEYMVCCMFFMVLFALFLCMW